MKPPVPIAGIRTCGAGEDAGVGDGNGAAGADAGPTADARAAGAGEKPWRIGGARITRRPRS